MERKGKDVIEILKRHKTEICYVLVIVLIIVLGQTVFASTDTSSGEPVIIVNTEESPDLEITQEEVQIDLEETDTEETPSLSPTVPEDESNENVESETLDKKDSSDAFALVVEPEQSQTVGGEEEISADAEMLKAIATLLLVLIFGVGIVVGVLISGKAFGWMK